MDIKGVQAYTELVAVKADDGTITVPNEIEVLHEGKWEGPNHPKFTISASDIDEYITNHNNGVRKGVAVDIEHRTDPLFGKQAAGWISKLYSKTKANGQKALMASVDWNKLGTELVGDKRYRFLSGEFNPPEIPYRDPEGKLGLLKNVLKAVTLTNSPLMKGLAPVMATEGGAITAGESQIIIYAQGESMKLEEVRTLEAAKLTDEQKTFLEEHKAELSATELEKFGLKVEAKKEEPKVEAPKVPVTATEDGTVAIKATDLADLQAAAELGRKAHGEIDSIKASEFAEGLVATDKVIKAGGKDAVAKFYLGLNETQRDEFKTAVVPNMHKAGAVMAGELGEDNAGTGITAAAEELHTKTVAKAAEDKSDYPTAMKSILATDEDLRNRVQAERKSN